MEQGCPVCNGLTNLLEICPRCGEPMEDCGGAENYYDAYSPYESVISPQYSASREMVGDDKCVHFLHCPICAQGTYVAVNRIML